MTFEREGARPDGTAVKVGFSLAFARDDRAPDARLCDLPAAFSRELLEFGVPAASQHGKWRCGRGAGRRKPGRPSCFSLGVHAACGICMPHRVAFRRRRRAAKSRSWIPPPFAAISGVSRLIFHRRAARRAAVQCARPSGARGRIRCRWHRIWPLYGAQSSPRQPPWARRLRSIDEGTWFRPPAMVSLPRCGGADLLPGRSISHQSGNGVSSRAGRARCLPWRPDRRGRPFAAVKAELPPDATIDDYCGC